MHTISSIGRGGGQFTKAGIPDIIACVNGRFVGIEVKASGGKPSELQILNLRKIHNAGGYAVLLFPDQWELFKEFITEDFANYNELKARWEEWELQFKSH